MNTTDKNLLPCNATPLERSLATLSQRLETLSVRIADLYHAARCPSNALPWLAWTFSVDNWPLDLKEVTQRRIIAHSLIVHQKKGTRAAVVQACEKLNYAVAILEAWEVEPPKPAHTFEVHLLPNKQNTYTHDDYERLIHTLDAVKPARSHYAISVCLKAEIAMNLCVASTLVQTVEWTITPTHPIKMPVLAIGLLMPIHIEQHLH